MTNLEKINNKIKNTNRRFRQGRIKYAKFKELLAQYKTEAQMIQQADNQQEQ